MIYTTYFAVLHRLPANIVPVAICLWPPKWYAGLCCPALAPTSKTLRQYKNDGDWDAYTVSYNKVLEDLDPKAYAKLITEMAGGKDIALVCFEKDYTHCHRSLVAAWMNNGGVPCKEYGT